MNFFSMQYVFTFSVKGLSWYIISFLYSAMTFLDTLCAILFLLRTFLSTLLAFLIMGYALFMIFVVMGFLYIMLIDN